jgi:competence protein ComEC
MSPSRSFGPLTVAIAVAVGIAVAPALDRLGVDPLARWVLAIALATQGRRHRVLIIAAMIAAGAARGAQPAPELPAGVVADDRIADRLIGVVHGPVVRTDHGTAATLDVGTAEIWIWSDASLVPGEQLAITGLVRTAHGWRDPAVPEPNTGFEVTAQTIERLGDAAGTRDRAWRWADAIQARWARTIDDAGGDPIGRAALRGIAVGDRSAVPEVLDDRWRAIGIYHVLSVSGLHLAVVAGLVFAVLRRLVAASWLGGRVRPARWAAPPALLVAIAYTLVTGAQLATLRALIVVALVLIAAMLDRPVRLVDALGIAALVILAWRPADLFDPSFQLSFTAALTLAVRPPPSATRRGVRGWIARGVAASLWITITTAPITAYHFQQVAAGGIVGNLVFTPILEVFALPLALAGIALGSVGTPLIRLATWIVTQIDRAVELLAGLTPVGHVAVAGTITLAVLVAITLWLAARARRTRADTIAWIVLCAVWSFARTPPPPGALRVTFLDVGQGDAAILELPDGAVWLFDAGGLAGGRDPRAASAPGKTVARVLAGYGHDHVDLAIVSHPHPDHYLGFAALDVPITELWSATELEPASRTSRSTMTSFTDITSSLAARGTRLEHPPLGLARSQAGVELEVWAPRYQATSGGPVVEAADPVRSVNDNSLVVAVRYRGRTIMFPGDLEHEGEELVVAAGAPRVDVVKVPHHGSPTSSSPAFVAATHPSLAVISCGRGNSFGFPSPDVVARWGAVGADVARTDLDGAITVVVDAAGRLTVDRFARPAP